MAIEWNDKLSVGSEQIDEDHKHLIKLINAYERVVAEKKFNVLGQAFAALEDYANAHFAREEKIMEAIHFPYRRSHMDEHIELLQAVHHKHMEIEASNEVSVEDLSAFLRSWLIDHVIKEDMQIGPYLKGGRTD